MNATTTDHLDALGFAKLLKKTRFSEGLRLGKFLLPGTEGVATSIQYNRTGDDMLGNRHEYTFPLLAGDVQVSLQLYRNISEHYRLFCYTRVGNVQGMTFSINLTTAKESGSVIFLTQKIRFAEQYEGSPVLARALRRQKQVLFVHQLRSLGYEVTENNDLILGIYDPVRGKLVNTTPADFLNDFLVVSLLKGHYQGNKGYQLEVLPNVNELGRSAEASDDDLKRVPLKVVENKSKRAIPLGMRYLILKNDGFQCVTCGHGPAEGAKLHVDHKVPFSLGGLTVMSNLRTLCANCNLGRSNRFTV